MLKSINNLIGGHRTRLQRGHVAIFPITISSGMASWYGLGSGQGIGSRLLRAALAELQRLGGQGCVVLGNPSYYGRFGFKSTSYRVFHASTFKHSYLRQSCQEEQCAMTRLSTRKSNVHRVDPWWLCNFVPFALGQGIFSIKDVWQ